MNKLCVIGLGYIGLPTAIVAAEHGYEVVGYDIDAERVSKINRAQAPIHEPELEEKLKTVIQHKVLRATTQMEEADYFLIAVPTPFTESKKADLSYVFAAAQEVSRHLKRGDTVILESTVPAGTTQKTAQLLEEKTGLLAGKDFFLAYCPERVLPGKIFFELLHNHRIIGGINTESSNKARHFYELFVKGSLYQTDCTTAELVKLIENSSRDVALAFAHQVASIAQTAGVDPYTVIDLANKHPRVNILKPTCGVGGHCLAVDPWFLVESFPEETELLNTSRKINDAQPHKVVKRIRQALDDWQMHHTGHCQILLLGITYKPNVDDIRESPALFVAQEVSQWTDCRTLVYDPFITSAKLAQLLQADTVNSLEAAVRTSDIIVPLVAHSAFNEIKSALQQHVKVIDACGLLAGEKIKNSQKDDPIFRPARTVSMYGLQE